MSAGLPDLESVAADTRDDLSQIIPGTLVANLPALRAASELLRGARRVRLFGVGLSEHAANAAVHIFRSVGVDARVANAYDMSSQPGSSEPGDLLLGFLHSGANGFTMRVLQRAMHAGLPAVVVTEREPAASPTGQSPTTLLTGERDLPPLAALSLCAALAARLDPQSALARSVASLGETIRKTLHKASEMDLPRPSSRVILAGTAGNFGIASYFAALQRAEGRSAFAFHVEDLIANATQQLEPDDLVVLLSSGIQDDRRLNDLTPSLAAAGCTVWKIGGDDQRGWQTTHLPDTATVLMPLLSTIPLQKLVG